MRVFAQLFLPIVLSIPHLASASSWRNLLENTSQLSNSQLLRTKQALAEELHRQGLKECHIDSGVPHHNPVLRARWPFARKGSSGSLRVLDSDSQAAFFQRKEGRDQVVIGTQTLTTNFRGQGKSLRYAFLFYLNGDTREVIDVILKVKNEDLFDNQRSKITFLYENTCFPD